MSYFSYMFKVPPHKIRIAILDLYAGTFNHGMRCLRNIIDDFKNKYRLDIEVTEFEVRLQEEIPSSDFDIYISSGGPGSPLESEHTPWEIKYFEWMTQIINYNKIHPKKKNVFFICHSFQLACRFFNVGTVKKRKSTSFGVFPIHLIQDGPQDHLFEGLTNPFFAVDNRDYQVVQPNDFLVKKEQIKILAIEKERPFIPLERAIMAIRFSDNIVGTQFHPEADAAGMLAYLQNDKKELVIQNHGIEKWQSMVEQLNDPEKIARTQQHILPNFLSKAIFS